jgi:capsule polysaccharide modification protein KpsS
MVALVTDPHTHPMDRGYVDYTKMDQWVKNKIRFAMRIKNQNKATILETYETSLDGRVTLDAKVIMDSDFIRMKNSLRIVEFN